MVDPTQLCDSLILWVSTFNIDVEHTQIQNYTDGVVVAKVLHLIDSEHFSDEWLARIKTGVGDNLRLKISNMKKVIFKMAEYLKEVCGFKMIFYEMPDVNRICEHSDLYHISQLLQILLGLAVSCPNKQKYIEDLMQLDSNIQQVVMTAIQDVMDHFDDENPASEEVHFNQQLKDLQDKLNDAISEKEEMAQRCHELDMQVAVLQEEKSNIEVENDQLQKRLNTDSYDDPNSAASIRHTQMIHQINELQEETYKLEAALEDYKLKCEVLEHDLSESQAKQIEYSDLAEESRKLKDEVDYLKSANDKATKLEDLVQTYKDRLTEFNELRHQLKLSEDKNTEYVGKIVALEDDLKKAQVAKAQHESNTRKLVDTQTRLVEETRRASKAEFEVQNKNESIKNLQSEKERLIAERNSLRQTNEDLQLAHSGQHGFMNEQLLSEESHENQLQLKEKVIRLEHENKMLKLEQGELGDERINLLNADLEAANARINEIETENKISKQRVCELMEQISDLQKQLQDKGDSDDENASLRRKLTEHLLKLKQTNEELQRKNKYIETFEGHIAQDEKIVNELKEQLEQKEKEMKLMEERYKNYLEKAKKVIRNLDARQNQVSNPELTKLKMEIADKEKYIKQLEKDFEKSSQVRDQEEKYIVNAWYNMGMQLHRKAVDERLSHTNPGQSFLARQRQASSNRRSHPGHVHSYLTNTS